VNDVVHVADTTSLISWLINGILGSNSQLLRNAQMRYIPNWLLKSVASCITQMCMDGAMAYVDVQFQYLCRQQAWNGSEIVWKKLQSLLQRFVRVRQPA
jgi:hypothetical protein